MPTIRSKVSLEAERLRHGALEQYVRDETKAAVYEMEAESEAEAEAEAEPASKAATQPTPKKRRKAHQKRDANGADARVPLPLATSLAALKVQHQAVAH